MITLNKIRELVLSQEQELEKLIFEYFLQKDITIIIIAALIKMIKRMK